MLNLLATSICSTQLQRYVNFSLVATFKAELAVPVMTVEFGTIHHYPNIEEIPKHVCAALWTDEKTNKQAKKKH